MKDKHSSMHNTQDLLTKHFHLNQFYLLVAIPAKQETPRRALLLWELL